MFNKKIINLIGKDKYLLYLITIINVLNSLLNIVFIYLICLIIQILFKNSTILNISDFKYYTLFNLLILILIFINNLIKGKLTNKLGLKAKINLRNKLFNKYLKLSFSNKNINVASFMQLSIEGVEQLELYYSFFLPQFFYSLINPIFLFIIFMFLNHLTALFLLFCVPLIPLSIIIVSKKAKKVFAKYWVTYNKLSNKFYDNLMGLNDLKIFNADKAYQDKMDKDSEEFRIATMKVLSMQLSSITIMDLVAYLGSAIGIIISFINIKNVNSFIYLDSNFVILFIILISIEFFLPLRALGSAFHVSMNGVTAGKNIIKILDYKENSFGNKEISDFELKIKKLSFKYSDANNYLLKDIYLNLNETGLVGLCGESGSGKSTLISILTGGNKEYEGDIFIKDYNLKDISKDSLYSNIALISSSSYLFKGSLRSNFHFYNSSLSDEEIYLSLKKVNLLEFVNNNKGLDFEIEEDCSNLSGGEKQRLILAINLLLDKKLYIFDEATSNIDFDSEKNIMENILELSKKKSVLLISHRLANFINVDKLYVLENYILKEYQGHKDCMDKNNFYNKLYTSQIKLENSYKELK
ncbi:MAG: ABC transporter ATP-binding protein/permease [Bacillales bacterium]